MSLHQARAKRNVRVAQISALGLVGLAGLLMARPPAEVPEAGPLVKPADPPAPQASEAPSQMDYALALATLQDRVERRAEPPKVEPIEEPIDLPEPKIEVEPVLETGAPHFRYLGSIETPRRSFAFIQEPDGVTTKMVAQGELIGDYLVLGISAEKMILENTNNTDERIEYGVTVRPETMPADSTLGMATPAPAQAGAKPGNIPNMPTNMHNSPSAAGRNGEMAYDELKDPNLRERYKEIEEKRAAAMNKNGVQPPPRPNPTTGQPQPRPATPPSKAPGVNSKDQK